MNPPFDFDEQTGKVTVRGAVHFPHELLDLGAGVKILDLSNNQFTELPDDLNHLSNLEVLFFSNNRQLQVIPEVLAGCSQLTTLGMRACSIGQISDHALPAGLRALILTDNHLMHLPRAIGNCTQLQKLMVAGNALESLPEELSNCRNLEIVRFAANKLATPPEWLFTLPKLAWYGDAGNPYSLPTDLSQISTTAWGDIRLGAEIGRSTNNIVYQGHLPDGTVVAVKIFGHDLMTDGLSADDMNACLQAGQHPQIIGAIGPLSDTPDGKQALVMPLVASDFKSLGQPPDLATVCHDRYPGDQSFQPSYVQRVLRDVAAGMSHLHSRGVMHGDLYAHNIMTDSLGNSLVGDFGAASLYEPGSAAGQMRERIDVRAFGILAQELLDRCAAASQSDPATSKLQELAVICLNDDPAVRPLFNDICASL